MKKSWALVIAWIALAYWADDMLTDIFGLLRIDLSKYFPLIIPFLPIIPVLLGIIASRSSSVVISNFSVGAFCFGRLCHTCWDLDSEFIWGSLTLPASVHSI